MIWRLPFGGSSESWPPMEADHESAYPDLQPRFEELRNELVPAFTEHDEKAIVAQRTHRRFQFALIVGSIVTAFLGALQAGIGDGDAAWVGFLVAAAGILTSAMTELQARSGAMSTYLSERAKAEELRSLYFRYLGGLTDDDALRAEVANIQFPRESS